MKKHLPKLIGKYVNTLARIAPTKAGKLGFKLFCHPVRTSMKPHQQEFLDTAEKFSFLHKDTKLQGYRWGNGPKKVLFIHGWKSHSFRWKNYVQALSEKEYTLYALDAPGHGLSEGTFLSLPLYSQVIEQLVKSIGPLDAIVSHSIGSFACMYMLYTTPTLPVGRLAIMGAPGEVRDFIDVFKSTLSLTDRAVEATLQHFVKAVGQPVGFFSSTRFAAELKLPGLIIHDKADEDCPYRYATAVNEVWKGARLLPTEGLTHNLRSPLVVEAIVSFLEEQSTSSTPEVRSKLAAALLK